MKQTLILALVALLASMGGGTWFGAYLAAPPAVAAAPSGVPVKPTAHPKKPAVPAVVDSVAPGTAPTVTDTATSTPKPRVDGARVAAKAARAKAVGRILVGMKVTEAADILGKMSDDEVESIVRQLNPKQVAGLLAVLPDARAAALSRRLLEPDSLP